MTFAILIVQCEQIFTYLFLGQILDLQEQNGQRHPRHVGNFAIFLEVIKIHLFINNISDTLIIVQPYQILNISVNYVNTSLLRYR